MLLNTLASEEQLALSPSRQDGIPEVLETQIRIYGCQLIQDAGILLDLPQRTMATAQVLYQRFWFVSSLKHFSSRDICMGALFLSTKLEETPKRLRDLINVFDYLIQRDLFHSRANPSKRALEKKYGAHATSHPGEARVGSPGFTYQPQGYFSTEFYEMKDALVVAEMQLLKRLGFNVQVNLPYATLINYLQLLGLAETSVSVPFYHQAPDANGQGGDAKPYKQEEPSAGSGQNEADHPGPARCQVGFAQRAWSFLNDALQTPLYCLLPPHVLACSVIYLTAQTAEPAIALPLRPSPWWELFDVDFPGIQIVCCYLLRLYHPQGPSAEIRRETGGLSELLQKKDVRDWLAKNGTKAELNSVA
ncbi:hypothetical protein ACQY0O_008385 [Thecaphora frezii]